MCRKLLILGLVLLMSSVAFGARYTQKQIQFVNEWGDDVNMGTSVSLYIYDVGTTTEKTCYLDSAGSLLVTQAVEDDSSNTPLDYGSGLMTFWSRDASYKMTVTDGTYTRTLDNITTSDTRMMWPTFLVALSSYSLGISEDLDFTYGAWVLDGDTAGTLDIIPDAADGVLNIGTSAGTTQGDVYVYASSTEYIFFNQDVAELNLTHVDQIVDDDSTLYFGDGKDISFKYHNTNSDLDITGDGLTLTLGATGAGLDFIIWGQTGNFVYFDEDNDRTFFEDWDLRINEGGLIEFADTNDAVDWTMKVATPERLEFIPTETTDDQVFNIGNATYTSDVGIFGKTASTVVFDASADKVIFDVYNVEVLDTSNLVIGSDDEWTIDNSSEVLRIIGSDADDDFAVILGVTTEGVDFKVWGATGTEYMEWDASADYFHVLGDKALLTLTGTTAPFKVDVTGTVAGAAITLETTNGGLTEQIDGSDNGDWVVNVGDDATLTVAGDYTLAVTGSTVLPNDVLLKASVALTAADMNTLAASPKEILASPAGTDLTYEFVSGIIALDYGSAAWTEPSAPDDLCFRYTDGSGAILSMLVDATGLATATGDVVVFVAPVADIVAGTTAAVAIAEASATDQSIVLDNTGSDWTGSGDSVCTVIIYYRIHTTAELGL